MIKYWKIQFVTIIFKYFNLKRCTLFTSQIGAMFDYGAVGYRTRCFVNLRVICMHAGKIKRMPDSNRHQ